MRIAVLGTMPTGTAALGAGCAQSSSDTALGDWSGVWSITSNTMCRCCVRHS